MVEAVTAEEQVLHLHRPVNTMGTARQEIVMWRYSHTDDTRWLHKGCRNVIPVVIQTPLAHTNVQSLNNSKNPAFSFPSEFAIAQQMVSFSLPMLQPASCSPDTKPSHIAPLVEGGCCMQPLNCMWISSVQIRHSCSMCSFSWRCT